MPDGSISGRRARIADVARAAGVSPTTASHALNGKGRVSEVTRMRILSVAEELGYSPDPAAKALVSGSTGIVALTVSMPEDLEFPFAQISYYMRLFNGAAAAATQRGWALVVVPAAGRGAMLERLAFDGIVVVEPADGDTSTARLRERRIPVVTIGSDPAAPDDPLMVDGDDVAGTRMALDHFIENGARRVALLGIEPYDSFSRETLSSFTEWCAANGLEPETHLFSVNRTGEWQRSTRAAAERFASHTDRPDAVLCPYQELAASLLAECASRGIAVPQDLMIATYDDFGDAENSDLTIIEVNPEELGSSAVERLIDAIDGVAPTEPAMVPVQLVPRGSTDRTGSRQ